jgi:hypothetical protein
MSTMVDHFNNSVVDCLGRCLRVNTYVLAPSTLLIHRYHYLTYFSHLFHITYQIDHSLLTFILQARWTSLKPHSQRITMMKEGRIKGHEKG